MLAHLPRIHRPATSGTTAGILSVWAAYTLQTAVEAASCHDTAPPSPAPTVKNGTSLANILVIGLYYGPLPRSRMASLALDCFLCARFGLQSESRQRTIQQLCRGSRHPCPFLYHTVTPRRSSLSAKSSNSEACIPLYRTGNRQLTTTPQRRPVCISVHRPSCRVLVDTRRYHVCTHRG